MKTDDWPTEEIPSVPHLNEPAPVWFQVLVGFGLLLWCIASPVVLVLLAGDQVGLW